MPINRETVLEIFRLSKERGTAVGLRLAGRAHLLITSIEQVRGTSGATTTVIVRDETIYGEFLPKNEIPLTEIEYVALLRVKYDDPFYQHLRHLRSNIRIIRQEAGLEKKSAIS